MTLPLGAENGDPAPTPPHPRLEHSGHHPACSVQNHERPSGRSLAASLHPRPFRSCSFLPLWTSHHPLFGSSGLDLQTLCSSDGSWQKMPHGFSGVGPLTRAPVLSK